MQTFFIGLFWRITESSAVNQCTEVRFASFLSSGFITAIVVNPPERKLAKHTSVHWRAWNLFFFLQAWVRSVRLVHNGRSFDFGLKVIDQGLRKMAHMIYSQILLILQILPLWILVYSILLVYILDRREYSWVLNKQIG